MQKTGLSRIQIYKWFFDMKLQQQPKQKKVATEERVCEPVAELEQDLQTAIPRPIFLVEKVVRI